MPREIKKGSTNITDYMRLETTSGTDATGVTITGLDLQYVRNGSAPSAKVDATALASSGSAHTDNAMIEIDATDQPGLYRVDYPDTASAAGVPGFVFTIKGSGIRTAHKEIQLVDFDPEDSVRLGLTSLPNAAADAAGGLVISDAGDLDMDGVLSGNTPQGADNNTILSNADYGLAKLVRSTTPANTLDVSATGEAGLDFNNIKDATGAHTLTNVTVPVVVTITGNVDGTVTGKTPSETGDAMTLAADAIKAVSYDESTAFPLKANDTGATQVARVGADGDTLEILSDEIAAVQSTVSNIASGTAATNQIAGSFVKSGAEVETNSYVDTATIGTIHIVEPDAGTTDVYYQFDIGANGSPVSVLWQGYAASQGDSYSVRAYNWGTTTWDQVKVLSAVNGTTVLSHTFDLDIGHVGIGANAGLVRLKFYSTDGTAVGTDRILCSFATVYQSVGYANGSIWVDTINGTAGTTNYINGTADNPVDTWVDALTLSGQLKINTFAIANSSSISLTGDSSNYKFIGNQWELDLNGQALSNTYIYGADIHGICTGSDWWWKDCRIAFIAALSFGPGNIDSCLIGHEGIILTAAGIYSVYDSHSINGTGTIIDFENASENKTLNITVFNGDIELRNFGHATGIHKVILTGMGHFIFNSNCSAATAADILDIHGTFHITDNVGGGWGGTTQEEARFDVAQITGAVPTAANVVDEWETQSQADPTGFHVNVLEVAGTGQTAGDISAQIDAVPTVGEIRTEIESSGSHLDYIIIDQVYKKIITEATGNTEQFNAAGGSLGTVAAAYTTDGTYTTRKKMVI